MDGFINTVLLTLLVVITIAIVRMRSLFGVVALTGVYSFLMACVLMVYDAVDVAMTEAAVGAGVSTVLFLAALHLTQAREYPRPRPAVIPLVVSVGVGLALIWATYDLPAFGIADTPINNHVAPHYLQNAVKETNVANVVSAVLADYRGFDTFGETIVVFTAAIGVMLMLRGHRPRRGGGTGDTP